LHGALLSITPDGAYSSGACAIIAWNSEVMSIGKTISEDMLAEARLDGLPCKGLAWVETTKVDVRDSKGETRTVNGVRTWHGKAVLERGSFSYEQLYNRPLEYHGVLTDGESERRIKGHVFVSHLLTTHAPYAGGDGQVQTGNYGKKIYVEFVGAGRLVTDDTDEKS
jgi:hypothetical protein